MKKNIVALLTALVITASLGLAGCSAVTPADIVKEEKDFTGFTSVDVGAAFEVVITQGSRYSVTISAEKSLVEYLDVSANGSVLKLYINPRHFFTDFTSFGKTLKAEIVMPELQDLSLSGASKGEVSGFISSGGITVNVSGASSLKMTDMGAGGAKVNISGASSLKGDLKAQAADIIVSGASSAVLEGSAEELILEVSGASRADLEKFDVETAGIELSGASEGTLHVKGILDAVVSGASRLYFLGNPTLGDINVSGSSTVKHK